MIQRTILEFNHDQLGKVEQAPGRVYLALIDAMRGDLTAVRLLHREFGVRLLTQRQHCDRVVLNVNGLPVFDEEGV